MREERTKQILAAGLQIFAEQGYHRASVADICGRAEVARGTFYLYYPSKRDLFDAVMDALIRDLERGIRRVDVSPGAAPPLEQLKQNMLWLLSLPRARPEMLQVLLWEAVGVDDVSDRKLASLHHRMFELTRRSLETGQALGLVRPSDTDVTARAVVGAVKELLLSLRVRGDLPQEDLAHLADELLAFATRGLLSV
ncbi:MAG: TetR/AcrR family transcriptional regulator [Deltaproteobacteria bacterium]|nr:TetR/AcrR family transcriptional regulator [Deltaproteobacteria bacterium]